MPREIRSIYDEHERPKGFVSVNPTMTQQGFKDECDINVIMAHYEKNEFLIDPMTPRTAGEPLFGDFSDIPDLMTAQNKLIEAQEMFDLLPARIRKDFDNDPVAFVEFCQDPANEEKLRDYGILPKIYTREDGMKYYFRDGMPVFIPSENEPSKTEIKTE